ncbi:hypothetical protein [Candidatus Bodocaedibacter vickermanii]|uniref:hypothetical protein n=1 Tax=Candidatus Bodocaedibacter vickermanii TaxID=2741701 RepID=UPI003307A77F
MNHPTKLSEIKASERKKRLEAALKRNMLRRKEQSNQRNESNNQPINTERGINNDNVR